jgi:hypothetical protein
MIPRAFPPAFSAKRNRYSYVWPSIAEGPDNAERLTLQKLAQEPDKLPFWRFLREVSPPYVQYRLQRHTLTLGDMR